MTTIPTFDDEAKRLAKQGRPDLTLMMLSGATFISADGFVFKKGAPVTRAAAGPLVTKAPPPPTPPPDEDDEQEDTPPPLAARSKSPQPEHPAFDRSPIDSLLDEARGFSTTNDGTLESLLAEAAL